MKDKLIYPKNLLKLDRSKWKMPHYHKTTFMHGDLVPFDSIEVLPGDTIKVDLASMIRMSTPIVPIMDNIEMHFAAYFVPNRLAFENWEELCGANKDGSWTVGMKSVVVPQIEADSEWTTTAAQASFTNVSNYSSHENRTTNRAYMTLGNYFISNNLKDCVAPINLLRFRDYYLIWNEHYRSQVVSAPIAVDLSSANAVIVGESPFKSVYRICEPLGKFPDYFTKALPEPQKGPEIAYLSDLLPVGIDSVIDSDLDYDSPLVIQNRYNTGSIIATGYNPLIPNGENDEIGVDYETFVTGDNPKLVASTLGTMRSINDLRYAFQLQKFLEKDARFGTRYFEYLNAHYGVTVADSVAQRPQFLGEINFKINIDQVLSTADATTTTSTKLGQPGANSTTYGKGSLFTFSSVEHGYIIIVGGARHSHTYSNVLDRSWLHISKLDFYHPEFANIGEQPVYISELASDFNDNDFGDIFGYQEAWAEYRFIPDRVTGLLSPGTTGALSYWTLADYPHNDAAYLLTEEFIYENRDSISRCLVTGSSGPDYIANIFFDTTVTRVMPVYSIPGFADHH